MSARLEEPAAGRVLGVDVGSARVGLASSDETRTVASPLRTLQRRSPDMWAQLADAMQEREARMAVVGLPRRLDGSESDAARDARGFAAELRRRTGAQVHLWDERFTTALAERSLITGGMRRERRRRTVDAVAASLMLQSWLDAQSRPA